MAADNTLPHEESDLDKTDRLPILEGVLFDPDVADDAVPLERVAPDSVRPVDERIARKTVEFEALTLSYQRLRDAQSVAAAHTTWLEGELAAARDSTESQRLRVREAEGSLADKVRLAESARGRLEEALRETTRYQTESRALREALATRDATIVQVRHSLGERDAQLSALQMEHARALPALETRAQASAQLERDLMAVRAQLTALTAEHEAGLQAAAAAEALHKRRETELSVARADLSSTALQAASHFELLQTREWRHGFDQNLFRDLDARAGAADSGRDLLQAERDRLQGQMNALQAKMAAQSSTIDRLQAAASAQAAGSAQQTKQIEQADRIRGEWEAKLASGDTERQRLKAELAVREQALAQAQATLSAEQQRTRQMQAEHSTRLQQLQAEALTRDEEMTVLMAHLQEARRPAQSVMGESARDTAAREAAAREAAARDTNRLKEELALKTLAIDRLTEEGNTLRSALERSRSALEEREFLIRRLERSESNNANALGRIQSAATEWSPELIRMDGDRSISYALGRRTRIGRAPGCELHIDSSSVSRHHALILAGTREAVIEDLNSTNGVILNGRRVTRQVLNDGDIVTIGEIQFRYVAKPPISSGQASQKG